MTEMVSSLLSGAPNPCSITWDSINWKQAKAHVNQLQMRIAKAFHATDEE